MPAPAPDGTARYRGQRLGLPQDGPGSVASTARRALALVLDLVFSGLIAGLFVHARFTDVAGMQRQNWVGVLVWFVITVVAVGFFGFTPGMAFCGIRVIRIDGSALVGPLRAVPRTVLVALIVPAAIWDADNRGLHDKLVGTAVVRMR